VNSAQLNPDKATPPEVVNIVNSGSNLLGKVLKISILTLVIGALSQTTGMGLRFWPLRVGKCTVITEVEP
jgi:hypothetical protein